MPNDDFAFDAYDRLVGRKSMASSPVTLVVRNALPDRLDEIIDRCLSLLRDRKAPDEILLVVETEPTHRPPSMIGAITIRTAVLPTIAERNGLAWTLANARWPIAIFVGGEASLALPAFRAMLESLEHADVVVGRRRSTRASRNPLSWFVRRMFGVAVADPLSPFLGFRRESVADVPLELDEPLTSFELMAKSTFAFAIYDEVAVDDTEPASPPLHRELLSHGREILGLFFRPRFWHYSLKSGQVRRIPQETTPPPAGTGVLTFRRPPRLHRLREVASVATPARIRMPADLHR